MLKENHAPDRLSQKGKEVFKPRIISYQGKYFDLHMAFTGMSLQSEGFVHFPSGSKGPKKLLSEDPEVLKRYRERHRSETIRSLKHAGITAGKETGDEKNDMLKLRREKVTEIMRKYRASILEGLHNKQLSEEQISEELSKLPRKLPDEVLETIKIASRTVLKPKQRIKYLTAAVASQKYAMRGIGENTEIIFEYNKRKRKIVARFKTSDRSYQGYDLHSNPYEAQRLAKRISTLRIKRELGRGEINNNDFESKVTSLTSELTDQILDYGNIMGNACSVITSDGRRFFTIRSWINGSYRWDQGAAIAGLSDQQVDRKHTKQGKSRRGIRHISNNTIRSNTFQEGHDEYGILKKLIKSFTITGIVEDKIKKHSEVVGEMVLNIPEERLSNIILENAKTLRKSKLYEYAEGNFFTIGDDTNKLEILLTKVECPFPPTHAGGEIINAGKRKYYELLKQYNNPQRAFNETEQWVMALAKATDENYERMNKKVYDYWRKNDNEAWKKFVSGVKALPDNNPYKRVSWEENSPPEAYDPRILPEDQGLDGIFTGLINQNLINASQIKTLTFPKAQLLEYS